MDGPSAGVAVATAVYSASKNMRVDNLLAMTGEISVHGLVKPVGGVGGKVEAARKAGVKRVLIPKDNWLSNYSELDDIQVIPVGNLAEVLELALLNK